MTLFTLFSNKMSRLSPEKKYFWKPVFILNASVVYSGSALGYQASSQALHFLIIWKKHDLKGPGHAILVILFNFVNYEL